MKKVSLVVGMTLLGMCFTGVSKAEDNNVKLTAEADVVSSYIWRGQECAGFSVQPCLTLSWEKLGLSLDAWASVELMGQNEWANMTEFDWELAWTKAGLTLGLTDYSFCKGKYFSGWKWNSEASHNLEANLAYDFGKMAIAWNTVLTGADHHLDENGEVVRNYSTYVELTAPWKLDDIEGSVGVGASLWDDAFNSFGNDSFNVCNISLTATKEIKDIPFSATLVANPQNDKVYFVLGIHF